MAGGLLLAGLTLAAWGCRSTDEQTVHVTYYHPSDCAECVTLAAAVEALESEFPGEVVASIVDTSRPLAEPIDEELGFTRHSVVLRSPEGVIIFKQEDDAVDLDEVRERLREVID